MQRGTRLVRGRTAGAVAVAAALASLCAPSGVAWARESARGGTTLAVKTASWSAVATTNASAPWGSGPLAISRSLLGAGTNFTIVNTGTMPLQSIRYDVTPLDGFLPTAHLYACPGGSFTSTGTCSSQTRVSVPLSTTSTIVPVQPGDQLAVRLVVPGVLASATFGVTVTSGDIDRSAAAAGS